MLIGLAVSAGRPATRRALGTASSALGILSGHAYAAATIGAFAVLEHLGQPGTAPRRRGRTRRTRPHATAGRCPAGTLFLFSLTGVPPLAGFFGKLMVFGSALNVGDTADAAGGLRWWFIGPGDRRRAECGRGCRVLLANRGADVLSHALSHAPCPGRRRAHGGRPCSAPCWSLRWACRRARWMLGNDQHGGPDGG